MLESATKLAKTEPEKAKALLAAAVPAIRAMTRVPVQTVYLALAGRLMTEMGVSGGDQLVDEATVKARNFGLKDSEAYARGAVAEQLCERDLETALALVTPIQDEIERERHLMNIAYRIAPKMPDRAKQVVESIERPFRRDQGRARLAHRLAPTRLDQAESLAASIQERGETKAYAYTWMAEQIAATDRPRAWDFLSRAFDVLAEQPKHSGYRWDPLPPMAIAVRPAVKLGHPEAHAMMLRTLSLRPPAGDEAGDSRRSHWTDGTLALGLATVDAATAKEFLEMLMTRILAMPAGEDYERRPAPCDAALAALIVEAALCERFLDQLQKANRPLETAPLCDYALGDVKQREEVIRKALRLWRPDEE
ncbi:MAG: hypothetical protein FJ279_27085 [Planctomycetes bacterium]|nr:hypothetical protein [Planctomycetota bacterium]